MAVQTCTGLLNVGHSLGDFLVGQHVSVTTGFAVINAEGIAGEQAFQPRRFFQLARRESVVAAEVGVIVVDRFQVVLVLLWEVQAPRFGIGADLGDLHHFGERSPGLLFAFKMLTSNATTPKVARAVSAVNRISHPKLRGC